MPAIDRRIFQKRFSSSPRAISKPIKDLCRAVSPAHSPMWVQVSPAPGADKAECFHNVNAKVSRDGGEILYGWVIWEWPRVFIEAEHHAVWRNGDQILDVTPPLDSERKILFLPDPERIYDYQGKSRLRNIKRSLDGVGSAQAWIDATDRAQDFLEANSTDDLISFDKEVARPIFERIEQAYGHVIVSLAQQAKPNDPCFCGENRKFRKCCGPLINLDV